MSLDEFFTETTEPENPLRADLIAMIRARDDATPRHQQKYPGPSETAHPCMRRLAHKLMETPSCNPQFDPLPSIIGTALHTWLQSAATHANNQLGRKRWLTEVRVNVAAGLSGSCDLYDQDSATVIDWKAIGNSRFDKYRKQMNEVYRRQVHQYGRGFINAGLPVKTVAIAVIPRGRTLRSLHLWKEEYDDDLVNQILEQRNQVIALLDDFSVEQHPERFEWFPLSGPDCEFCDWWKPDPTSPLQCRGVNV